MKEGSFRFVSNDVLCFEYTFHRATTLWPEREGADGSSEVQRRTTERASQGDRTIEHERV
jgi:hypothetical protein